MRPENFSNLPKVDDIRLPARPDRILNDIAVPFVQSIGQGMVLGLQRHELTLELSFIVRS